MSSSSESDPLPPPSDLISSKDKGIPRPPPPPPPQEKPTFSTLDAGLLVLEELTKTNVTPNDVLEWIKTIKSIQKPTSDAPVAMKDIARAAAAAAAMQRPKTDVVRSKAALGADFERLVDRIARNQVKALDLAAWKLSGDALGTVLRDAPRSTMLKELSLSGVVVDDEALRVLGTCVAASKSVRTLNIERCGIKGGKRLNVLLQALGEAGALTTLNLASNPLGNSGAKVLAHWFEKSTTARARIVELSLAYAHIGAPGGTALAAGLFGVAVAKRKSKSASSSSSLPPPLPPALAVLHLQRNRLMDRGAESFGHALPRAAAGKLRVLTLAANGLSDACIPALAKGLEERTAMLTVLELGHNPRISGAGIAQVLTALGAKGTCAIDALELQGTAPVIGAAQTAFAQALANVRTLTAIDLWGANLGPAGIALLTDALINMPDVSLRRIGLRGNDLGAAGAGSVAKWLSSGAQVQRLDLSGNSLGPDGVRALAVPLSTGSTLESLDLSCNMLGDGGMQLIVPVFEGGMLQRLSLGLNNIGPAGAATIAKGLAGRKHGDGLAALDLNWNRLGAAGVEALAPVLRGAHCLAELSVAGNALGDDGAERFAAVAIHPGSQLLVVDLAHNAIGVVGMRAVGALLQGVPLVSCSVVRNDFADQNGAQELASALKVVRHLRRLDVRDNALKEESTAAICEAIQLNPVLEMCDLRGNKHNAQALQALQDVMERNAQFQCSV